MNFWGQAPRVALARQITELNRVKSPNDIDDLFAPNWGQDPLPVGTDPSEPCPVRAAQAVRDWGQTLPDFGIISALIKSLG